MTTPTPMPQDLVAWTAVPLAIKLPIKRLSDTATLPTKNHATDAGWDLYASQDASIMAGNRYMIRTDIAMMIPDGYVGLIWPRSGLASKHGADILGGVIDAGYRGEISVCLLNTASKDEHQYWRNSIEIKAGERIAQIVIQEIPKFELVEVEDLSSSNRGEKGFGSSGK